MRPRSRFRLAILALVAATAAACGSVEHAPDAVRGRAVVIHAADREADAADAAARLARVGLHVVTEREGPPVRERSSVAVYRVAAADSLLEPVQAAFEGFPEVEWLPFVHGGPPQTYVVVWLVSRERDAAARAADAASAED
jgi:hypothetical protein